MRSHLLLAVFSIGSVLPFVSVQAKEEAEWFTPFWYAGASVAHNGGHQIKALSQCDGLNGIIDGLHLGYQFNPYLMTEVEYQYLGCMTTAEQMNSDLRQGVVSVKLGYPLTENITPYLKAGATGWVNAKANGIAGVMGVGVSYRVFDDVAFNLEYQYTEPLGNDALREFTHQRFSLGIMYRFGHAKPLIITVDKPIAYEVFVETMVEQVPQIETVVITNTNNQVVLFKNNSSILISTQTLLPIVVLLNEHPKTTVVITGYSDNVGVDSYNQWLSVKRAQHVSDYLISQGIHANRITTEGKGEVDPIASNNTVGGRAMNRRVVIEFN